MNCTLYMWSSWELFCRQCGESLPICCPIMISPLRTAPFKAANRMCVSSSALLNKPEQIRAPEHALWKTPNLLSKFSLLSKTANMADSFIFFFLFHCKQNQNVASKSSVWRMALAYGLVSLKQYASGQVNCSQRKKVIFALMEIIFERESVQTHPGPIVTNHHFSSLAVHLGRNLNCLTTTQVSQTNLRW